MTKINKIGKSSFAVAILAFLLVAVLAFGGTYAYFSDATDKVSGSVTMGNLLVEAIVSNEESDGKISSNKIVVQNEIGQPNQVLIDNVYGATVKGNIAYYTRVKFTVTVKVADGHKHEADKSTADDATGNADAQTCNDYMDEAIKAFVITLADVKTEQNTSGTWGEGGVITEQEMVDPDGDGPQEAALQDIPKERVSSKYYYKLAPSMANNEAGVKETFDIKVQAKSILGNYDGTAEGCNYWMDAEITISITFEVLQADYLNDGITEVFEKDEDGELKLGEDGKPVPTTAAKFLDGAKAEEAWKKALGDTNKGFTDGDTDKSGVVGDESAQG